MGLGSGSDEGMGVRFSTSVGVGFRVGLDLGVGEFGETCRNAPSLVSRHLPPPQRPTLPAASVTASRVHF
jgi:hypothetical protein